MFTCSAGGGERARRMVHGIPGASGRTVPRVYMSVYKILQAGSRYKRNSAGSGAARQRQQRVGENANR